MTTTTEFKAKVLFRFVPENDEELDLNEGDVIKVIEKHDDGWCIAVFNGKTGYVPANYLEEIADTSSHKQRPTKPAPPIPQKPKSDQSSPSHSQSNGAAISKKESFASFAKAQKEAPKPPPKPAKHLHPTSTRLCEVLCHSRCCREMRVTVVVRISVCLMTLSHLLFPLP